MTHKKIRFALVFIIIFSLSIVSVAQAAPLPQTGDDPPQDDGTSQEDSLNLDEDGNNLGSIMSKRKGSTSTDDGSVDDTGDENGDEMDDTTGTGDGDGDTGDDPDDTGDDTDGTGEEIKEHPVASAIADYFGVEYTEVKDAHEEGYGFGNIAKAYFFYNRFGSKFEEAGFEFGSPLDLLSTARESGWGNFLKNSGIHPGSVGKGNGNRPDKVGKPDNGDGEDIESLSGPGNNNGNNGNGKNKDKEKNKGVNGRASDDADGGNGNGKSKGNNGKAKGKDK